MKTSKSILFAFGLILLVAFSAMAQSGPKVIAIVNHADWCPACQNNGERAKAVFMENNKDGALQFVVNNLTNDETKAQSLAELKKLGLDKAMEANKGTGIAYFFDAKTRKLITQISVAKTNDEIAQTMTAATKGA
jgi:Skp family chaperone for outer membrane proteins